MDKCCRWVHIQSDMRRLTMRMASIWFASGLELVGVEASFGSGSADLGDPRDVYGPVEAVVASMVESVTDNAS